MTFFFQNSNSYITFISFDHKSLFIFNFFIFFINVAHTSLNEIYENREDMTLFNLHDSRTVVLRRYTYCHSSIYTGCPILKSTVLYLANG